MVGVMIGYRAALDLGKHTGMTKASCGIVFGVNLGSVQVVGCQCTIFRRGICCRDSIELGPKQHVHSVLEA